jgi:malate dehydrogenase (oxaloacetate-decarboxylating)
MDYNKEALKAHKQHKGKISITSKMKLETRDDLSTAYTPGVAAPCMEIYHNPDDVYTYTAKGNLVAVLTDGSAVLGLGNIGGKAAMPVMEGKAILFKEFGGVDAFPICLSTQSIDEIVQTGIAIAPTFGGINLEDIAAPKCFEIEERLKAALEIPVFHDDQHGTAVVVSAGLINASKVTGKAIGDMTVVINGAGAAGTAICKMLMALGVKDVIVCDSKGVIRKGRDNLSGYKVWLADNTNKEMKGPALADAMKGADVFVGVSVPGIVTQEMVSSMAENAILFAMANPVPEIMPDEAKAAGAAVIGTGRSDFANQVNNVLAFPGIFRGALDARAKQITEEMKLAAARAIAGLIPDDELNAEYVIPDPFDKRVAPAVAEAVKNAWIQYGMAEQQ